MRKKTISLVALALLTIASTGWARNPIQASGVQGGLVVHLDCGKGKDTIKLRASDSYLVQGLEIDPAKLAAARKNIRKAGVYGKVTAEVFDGTSLPYLDNTVNLIVADPDTKVPRHEWMRALAPRGVMMLGDIKIVKEVPAALSDWTHALFDAKNNAVSSDKVVGPRPQHAHRCTGNFLGQ